MTQTVYPTSNASAHLSALGASLDLDPKNKTLTLMSNILTSPSATMEVVSASTKAPMARILLNLSKFRNVPCWRRREKEDRPRVLCDLKTRTSMHRSTTTVLIEGNFLGTGLDIARNFQTRNEPTSLYRHREQRFRSQDFFEPFKSQLNVVFVRKQGQVRATHVLIRPQRNSPNIRLFCLFLLFIHISFG